MNNYPVVNVISCGFILFRRDKDIEFLLIHSKFHGFWSFPKGRKEKFEKDSVETALREVEEEVGIPKDYIKVIPGFKEVSEYSYFHAGKIYKKRVIWHLGEVIKNVKVKIDNFEIDNYVWLPYEKAIEKLSFDKDKDILRKAYDLIK